VIADTVKGILDGGEETPCPTQEVEDEVELKAISILDALPTPFPTLSVTAAIYRVPEVRLKPSVVDPVCIDWFHSVIC